MKVNKLKWSEVSPTVEQAKGIHPGEYIIADPGEGVPINVWLAWDTQGDYPHIVQTREEGRALCQRDYENNVLDLVRQHLDLWTEKEIAARETVAPEDCIYDLVGGNVDDAYALGYDDGETFAAHNLLRSLRCK